MNIYTILRIFGLRNAFFGSFNTIVSWFFFLLVCVCVLVWVNSRYAVHFHKRWEEKRIENYIHCVTLHMHELSSNNQCGICILYGVSNAPVVCMRISFRMSFSHHQHCIPIYSRWTLSNVMSGVELSLSTYLSPSRFIYTTV